MDTALVRTGYVRVPWQEVQPGDLYKFVGADGRVNIGVVQAIEGRLVQVEWWDKARPMGWVYRDVSRVTFGRAVK